MRIRLPFIFSQHSMTKKGRGTMNEKKSRNIFQRAKDWWNGLTEIEKAEWRGGSWGFGGAMIGLIISEAITSKHEQKVIQKRLDEEYETGYLIGKKDGIAEGYRDLFMKNQSNWMKM